MLKLRFQGITPPFFKLLLIAAYWVCVALGAHVQAATLSAMSLSETASLTAVHNDPQVFSRPGVTLHGTLTQGALLRGKTQPKAKIWLGEGEQRREVQVSEEGYFALGFGRTAALTQTLHWQLPGKALQSTALTLQQRQYKIQKINGLPKKMVTPPKAVLTRIKEDNRAVRQARARRDPRTSFMQPFIWPAQGPISGVYGSQRVLNGKPKSPHYGIDVAGPVGQPVYAPAAGVVTLYHPDLYYSGGTLIIDHGHGITSTFLHLHKSHVEHGQVVQQGELIAEIGATGRVTGPHLDWRMNWLDQRVDPALLVPPMSAL